jgi:transposase
LLDLNNIEPIWPVLERKLKGIFPASSLKQLKDVLHEKLIIIVNKIK